MNFNITSFIRVMLLSFVLGLSMNAILVEYSDLSRGSRNFICFASGFVFYLLWSIKNPIWTIKENS